MRSISDDRVLFKPIGRCLSHSRNLNRIALTHKCEARKMYDVVCMSPVVRDAEGAL
jgi:hypothetical protein